LFTSFLVPPTSETSVPARASQAEANRRVDAGPCRALRRRAFIAVFLLIFHVQAHEVPLNLMECRAGGGLMVMLC
jgi:hypothetical protein